MLAYNFSFHADEFGVRSFGKTVEERSQRLLSAVVVFYLIYVIDCTAWSEEVWHQARNCFLFCLPNTFLCRNIKVVENMC